MSRHDSTDAIPAIGDFYEGPTHKMIRLPRQVMQMAGISSGKQREAMCSLREPCYSVIAWLPFLAFVVAFIVWSWVAVWVAENVNAILYVVVLWGR